MFAFDQAHRKVHVPDDRRLVVVMSRRYIIWLAVVVFVPILLAWLQVLVLGIHSASAPAGGITVSAPNGVPRGFPVWIRWTHFANLFFICLVIRSGLSILMDHPRLYWNDHSTPGTEWLRFTPIDVSKDRVWTSKDDARYISPVIACPVTDTLPAWGGPGISLPITVSSS